MAETSVDDTIDDMVKSFANWHALAGQPPHYNPETVRGFMLHLHMCATSWETLSVFKGAPASGTTETFKQIAQFLRDEQIFKKRIFLVGEERSRGHDRNKLITTVSWYNSFHGLRGHLLLCESCCKDSVSQYKKEKLTVQLLSIKNSVFYVTKNIVANFLALVDN